MPRVYIGRLSYQARERDVERFFKGYGKILEVDLKNGARAPEGLGGAGGEEAAGALWVGPSLQLRGLDPAPPGLGQDKLGVLISTFKKINNTLYFIKHYPLHSHVIYHFVDEELLQVQFSKSEGVSSCLPVSLPGFGGVLVFF
uniref:RRM domain-containing protein n=1 Tax=Cyanistes caeruleus TaxID=156563 RepID=A0A8C0USP5_CYACU